MFKSYHKSGLLFRIFNFIFLSFLVLAVLLPLTDVLLRSITRNEYDWLNGFKSLRWEIDGAVQNAIAVNRGDVPDNTEVLTGFSAYKALLGAGSLQTPLKASIVTTFAAVVFGLCVSAVSAYILTKQDMPGVKLFKWMLIFALIFDAGIIPRFLVVYNLRLLNTYIPIIVYLGFNVYNIMLLYKYFDKIPKELTEAAEIDGCSPVGTFFNKLRKSPASKAGALT